MVNIPFVNTAAFSQQVILDGNPFNITIVWNTRGEFWTISFFNTDDTPIVTGIKMVLGFSLLRGYKHIVALPPGALIVFDPAGSDVRPGFDDFLGTRGLLLLYATEAEVAAV